MTEEKKEKDPKVVKKKAEAKYPEGIEAKLDNMTLKDLEVILKLVCLNGGQNQLLTAAGLKPFTVQDAGKLVRKIG